MDPIAEPVAQRRAVGSRDRDRPHDLADVALLAEEVALLPHPRADVRAVAVELERSAHETGVSAATTSRMFIRHGVPSMTSRHPSHRIATLSSTIVSMRMPR